MKVLFVCTGNLCRSVLAELVLKKLSAEKGLGWKVQSCGTAADSTTPVPREIRRLAKELGFKDFHHQPRPASTQALAWADLVVTMTDSQMRELWTRFPEAKAKTQLLREFAGLGAEDVEDPYGGDEQAYRACLESIQEAVALLPEKPAGRTA